MVSPKNNSWKNDFVSEVLENQISIFAAKKNSRFLVLGNEFNGLLQENVDSVVGAVAILPICRSDRVHASLLVTY